MEEEGMNEWLGFRANRESIDGSLETCLDLETRKRFG
jgi:hypothetical protein